MARVSDPKRRFLTASDKGYDKNEARIRQAITQSRRKKKQGHGSSKKGRKRALAARMRALAAKKAHKELSRQKRAERAA